LHQVSANALNSNQSINRRLLAAQVNDMSVVCKDDPSNDKKGYLVLSTKTRSGSDETSTSSSDDLQFCVDFISGLAVNPPSDDVIPFENFMTTSTQFGECECDKFPTTAGKLAKLEAVAGLR